MKLVLQTLSILSLAIATPALAADMSVKSSRTAAAPVAVAPAYSWTGCYIGANAGWGWAHTKHGYDPLTRNVGGNTGDGFTGGGQVGCDMQFAGAWVLGIQGMYDWASLKGSNFYTPDHDYHDFDKVKSIATLTARLGYNILPISLLYVKGGAAWAKNKPYELYLNGFNASADYTASGWTIGTGWEQRLAGNWSWFIEYNYADFGSKDAKFTGPDTFTYRQTQHTNQVLVGLNYLFNAAR